MSDTKVDTPEEPKEQEDENITSERFPSFHQDLICKMLSGRTLASIVAQERKNPSLLKAAHEEKIINDPIRVSSLADQVLFKAFVHGLFLLFSSILTLFCFIFCFFLFFFFLLNSSSQY